MNSKSAYELSRINLGKYALLVAGGLEKHWAHHANAVSRLLSHEQKECEHLILETVLLKADLLAAEARTGEALETLTINSANFISQCFPEASIHLATKVK